MSGVLLVAMALAWMVWRGQRGLEVGRKPLGPALYLETSQYVGDSSRWGTLRVPGQLFEVFFPLPLGGVGCFSFLWRYE